MDFSLEPWAPGFADSLAASAGDARIARFLRDSFPYPYSHRDAEEFIAFASEENARAGFYRAVVIGGKAAGGISAVRGADIYGKSAELGYWLSPVYWGKGVMPAAVRALCREVFGKTDIVRIYAEPFACNAASCRVLEKCGFAEEGIKRKSVYKNGAFYDSIMYALIRE